MSMIVIERLHALPAGLLDALIEDSERAGLPLVRRLADEWASGANRFDGPGEALFGARVEGRLVGVGGLSVDPYLADPGVGRVRHLYVRSDVRRRGVGRRLMAAILGTARGRFDTVRLSTQNPAAARLYEGLGFRPSADTPRCTHRLDLR
jgi:GNAT superfamily N-acetyltransferase